MPKQNDVDAIVEESEVTRLLALDSTPWYRKSNLRTLYLCLVPAALGVEMTTGYDGSVLNGLQAVAPWQSCPSLSSLICGICTADMVPKQTSTTRPVPSWVSQARLTTWEA